MCNRGSIRTLLLGRPEDHPHHPANKHEPNISEQSIDAGGHKISTADRLPGTADGAYARNISILMLQESDE